MKQWYQNSYFGDIEIFIPSKRLCSCKAFEPSDLFILNKKYCFDIIEKEFPMVDKVLQQTARKRLSKLQLAYTNGIYSAKQIGLNSKDEIVTSSSEIHQRHQNHA